MIRLATVFSGIGAIEQALLKNHQKYKIVFACDNGEINLNISKKEEKELNKLSLKDKILIIKKLYANSPKTNYVKQAYFANYDVNESNWYDDIRFIDGKLYQNKVDLFVGGSPCQSFSIIGKKAGLNDARGTLFFEYARLIKEIQPKVFIYENVPGMLMHDKGNTWKVIREVFESLGYKFYYKILNSLDFGVPQNRRRLFVIGFKDKNVNFEFPVEKKTNKTMKDYLDQEPVAINHYLGKKGFEFVTNSKYKNRARINRDIMQTQKANQQFNWNGDFIFVDYGEIKSYPKILERAYVGEWHGKSGVCRQLTYRECMRLMGFSESYKIVVPNRYAYRQAGNSIVVNVLQALLKQIQKVVDLNE